MLKIGCASIIIGLSLGACTQLGDGDQPSPIYQASAPAGAVNHFGYGSVRDRNGEIRYGLLGPEIGVLLTEESQIKALAAEYRALEFSRDNQRVTWQNPATGTHGEVNARGAFRIESLDCRSFRHVVYIRERRKIARGTACRNVDRSWHIQN